MDLLLSTIVAGLLVWVGVALGVAVVLGRMCVKRDEQVCSSSRAELLRPAGSVRSSADATSPEAGRYVAPRRKQG